MSAIQQRNPNKLPVKATNHQRIVAGVVFVVIIGFFGFLWAAATGWIDTTQLFGICGFKERFHLPCLGCGMTRSGEAFVKGRILESFNTQPAGAFFCCVLVVIAVFSLLRAVFGLQLKFLHGLLTRRAILYLVLSVIIVLGCGWAVTLSRALAERNLP
jgi:hypothetical protein